MHGPGIKKDAPLYGVSVLDAAPTLLALFGLPAGEDMDGHVVSAAFEEAPETGTIPSWEAVPGEDGRHPPHTRLDPQASAEALEQLVALGYIEAPGEDAAENVEHTVRELRYNLLEAYQDANRHPEALDIARDLCRRDADEQRYAVKRFVSAQALGFVEEMREIVDDLCGRRRELYEEAVRHMDEWRETVQTRVRERGGPEQSDETIARRVALELHPQAHADPDEDKEWKSVLEPDERKDVAKWRRLRRYGPVVVEYLRAQVLTAEKRWPEALAALEQVRAVHLARPGLLLHTAELLRRLGRFDDAAATYRRALEIDPDNAQAHLGLGRLAIQRRAFGEAAEHAREALARLYFNPTAHFLLGVARAGMKDPRGAVAAMSTALMQNPHFPQAHLWLGRLLRYELQDRKAAEEHFGYYLAMRRHRARAKKRETTPATEDGKRDGDPDQSIADDAAPPEEQRAPALGPLGADEVLVVSGLPRSGTSMLMQMLAAGGMPVLSDHQRAADEDNPRGYFELEAIKKGAADLSWLAAARGKAVKVVAPLVNGLPPSSSHRYRVVFVERAAEEVLDSQTKMIVRRGSRPADEDTPERRERLRGEYQRILARTKTSLSARPDVRTWCSAIKKWCARQRRQPVP